MRSGFALVAACLGILIPGPVSAQENFPVANQVPVADRAMAQNLAAVGRAAMPAPRPPWSAIGRINRTPGGFCSGTLIAPDRVLTTANCLWDRSMGRWFHPGDLHFLAGYHLGKYIEYRRVVAMEFAQGVEINQRGYPRRASNDWAVLTLARPIAANGKIYPIKKIRLAKRPRPGRLGPLVRAGFSPLRPHALTTARCRAVAFFNRSALMHSCGAVSADSGFPILVQTSDGWRVLGLQMTTYNRDAKKNSIGMVLLVTAMSKNVQIRY